MESLETPSRKFPASIPQGPGSRAQNAFSLLMLRELSRGPSRLLRQEDFSSADLRTYLGEARHWDDLEAFLPKYWGIQLERKRNNIFHLARELQASYDERRPTLLSDYICAQLFDVDSAGNLLRDEDKKWDQDDRISRDKGPAAAVTWTEEQRKNPLVWNGIFSHDNVPAAARMWVRLTRTNPVGRKERAYGKIAIVRGPDPFVCGMLHYVWKEHLDTHLVFKSLLHGSRTFWKAHNPNYMADTLQGRTDIVMLSCLSDFPSPSWAREWQPLSDGSGWMPCNKNITRYNVVVALSLEAASPATPQHNAFNAWRVFALSVCRDDDPMAMEKRYPYYTGSISSLPHKHWVNGPEAFLSTFLTALDEVTVRMSNVVSLISKDITPEPDAIFKGEFQDKLLFDDDNFTYSRRYLMAHYTLGIIRSDVETIIATATREVGQDRAFRIWEVKHCTPAEVRVWDHTLKAFDKMLEESLAKLQKVADDAVVLQHEVRSLYDNLYNMTSIMENRRSVRAADASLQQNRNIKLLTLVTIFFLPLGYVTSIFGMSSVPQQAGFTHFAAVTAAISIPTYIIMGLLVPTNASGFWTNWIKRHTPRFCSSGRRTKEDDRASTFSKDAPPPLSRLDRVRRRLPPHRDWMPHRRPKETQVHLSPLPSSTTSSFSTERLSVLDFLKESPPSLSPASTDGMEPHAI